MSRRYPPDWKYNIADELLAALDEYHILKVPLLGQHYPGGPHDWCGRTAASMAYNYYQVTQHTDFESRFITHWDAGNPGYFVDLRFPGNQRAFHKHPTTPPHDRDLDGATILNLNYTRDDVLVVRSPTRFESGTDYSASAILGFSSSKLLDAGDKDRLAKAARIANDPHLLSLQLSTLLEALLSNNPVIFYSGFSMRLEEPIHLILIVGYAYLVDASGRHLWLVVADPATQHKKIAAGMFSTPMPTGAPTDLEGLAQLSPRHDLVRVIPGDYDNAKASLVLLRARKLFEPNPLSHAPNDLYMDYASNKGGVFLYSHRQTPVPREFLYSNAAQSVAYPFDTRKERFRPANLYRGTEWASGGLFPLGRHHNLHSGVHLESSLFTTTRPPRQVRCMAPGYIVAARLVNALPEATASEEAKQGLASNERSNEFADSHNGFILVRHDLEEVLPKPKPGEQSREPQRFTFYSLYMHLVPPNWKDPKTYQEVAWLKVLARRQGCLALLDPQHELFRQVRWLQASPEGTSPSDTSEFVPLYGGTFSTFGAGLGQPQPLVLGEGSAPHVRAVWKKPDRDLEQIHTALLKGEIVTFCHPFLKVRAGELLGFIDSQSDTGGDGFLHWEILAASGQAGAQSSLEKLLAFAEEKLGLAGSQGCFFKLFQEPEGTRNNYFDPPVFSGQGELDSLLQLAPTSPPASKGEERNLFRLQQGYDAAALQRLFRNSQALPFCTQDEAPPSSEPGHPVEIYLENYKGCLPPGSYKLVFTFEPDCGTQVVPYDGKQQSVRIHMPARARKLFVKPEGLFLQTGGTDKEALKRDTEHFKRLASVRWRNVLLRRLNEWSPMGVKAQLEARLKRHKQLQIGSSLLDLQRKDEADKLISEYVDSVAWWTHAKEKAFLGPDGQEKPLFSESADGEQLPEDTLIDNPHPVTLAWLLTLLTRHGFLRFTEAPLWRSEEVKQVAVVGWLPAQASHPPRRVGETVYVGALQRGFGNDPVVLQVKQADKTLEFARGTFTEGLFAQPVEVPGWGRWTLDAPGAEPLGSLELEGLEPRLLSAEAPPGSLVRKDSGSSWRIPFKENCPRLLRGWILLRHHKAKRTDPPPVEASAFTLAELAIPVEAREETALNETAGFELAGGFVQKGKLKNVATYITQHFTYKTFLDAAKGSKGTAAKAEPRLAWGLVEAVERIQCEYSQRQLLTLTALSEDGLALQLQATNSKQLRAAVDKVQAAGWLASVEEADKGALRVSVKEPAASSHPGELLLEFDPGSAFAELRKDLAPDEQRFIQFGCLFPNGGGALDARLLPTDPPNREHVSLQVEELKRAAGCGWLELWSTDAPAVLHRPGFGEPALKYTPSGLQISVELLGADRSFWNAAVPLILFGQEHLDKRAGSESKLLSNPLRVVRHVDFNSRNVQGLMLLIKAEAKNKQVAFEREELDVAPSRSIRYEVRPRARLEVAYKTQDWLELLITVSTHAVPAGRAFKVELLPSLKLPKSALRYKLPRKAGGGVSDSEGLFRAELDVSAVAAVLEKGTQYTLRVLPLDPPDPSLACETTLTVHEPLRPPVETLDDNPFATPDAGLERWFP